MQDTSHTPRYARRRDAIRRARMLRRQIVMRLLSALSATDITRRGAERWGDDYRACRASFMTSGAGTRARAQARVIIEVVSGRRF